MTEHSSEQQETTHKEGEVRPMPISLGVAIAALVLGLVYMAAVFSFGLLGLMLAMPAFGVLLAGFVSALVGLARKQNRCAPHALRYVGVLVGLVALLLFLIPGLGTIRLLNLHSRMRVARTGGQDELQSWAVDLLAQSRDGMEIRLETQEQVEQWEVPQSYWSKQVSRLKPTHIFIERLFQGDQDGVRMMYGGGFFHWYIVVGPAGSAPDPRLDENLPNSL